MIPIMKAFMKSTPFWMAVASSVNLEVLSSTHFFFVFMRIYSFMFSYGHKSLHNHYGGQHPVPAVLERGHSVRGYRNPPELGSSLTV
jgi:hypothetical protein